MSEALQKNVVGAVIEDDRQRVLLTWNDEWQGYSFPLNQIVDGETPRAKDAIAAVNDDLQTDLINARGSNLEFIVCAGVSPTSGRLTNYNVWLFQINLAEDHKKFEQAIAKLADSPHPPIWIHYSEIKTRSDVTWSAIEFVKDFVDRENVVLSIVSRAGKHDTEVLLVWNENYQGYFFPAQRIKSASGCELVAESTIKHDLGYAGELASRLFGEVEHRHYSPRYDLRRDFRYLLCEVRLPKVDLHFPHGVIEHFLNRREHRYKWVPVGDLLQPSVEATISMPAIATVVANQLKGQIIPPETRVSKGVVVLIQRFEGERRLWLLRRHEDWEAFTLIFGRRRDDLELPESVRAVVEEKLGTIIGDGEAESQVNFHAISRSTGKLTSYQNQVVRSGITAEAVEELKGVKGFIWASDEEIYRLRDTTGRHIHETALSLLLQADLLAKTETTMNL